MVAVDGTRVGETGGVVVPVAVGVDVAAGEGERGGVICAGGFAQATRSTAITTLKKVKTIPFTAAFIGSKAGIRARGKALGQSGNKNPISFFDSWMRSAS